MHEAQESVSGVASIGQVWQQLVANNLQDRVTFLSLNVFGRTLGPQFTMGRAHNANHHVSVVFGAPFRGGVIGSVEPKEGDYGATSIDSKTGRGVPGGGGDIQFMHTFQSMALTFGIGVGANRKYLAESIHGGQQVPPMLAG
jgi:hypothetical protein